ncbi:MAG: sugar phosphate nucleotidyltransferase [Oligoflexia bacterium]|nr:sugar phosphate nucleotidyltransferase [Oligoflexia bacterium]
MKRFAIIMAGGSGTRFWPKSTKRSPKQLLPLTSQRSLLQMTNDRLNGLVDKTHRWVISTKLLEKDIKKQLGAVKILSEPVGRNTMAAVCWGAWSIAQKHPDALVAVLPADAHITENNAYKAALKTAFEVADNENRIVCLGMKPTYAATGYGYIQAGQDLQAGGLSIVKFIEKPSLQTAETLVSSKDFLWNAGIFVFKVKTFIEETRKHAPAFAKIFDSVMKTPKRLNSVYKTIPKEPVDIALMEKTDRGAVLPCDFGWNDLGSWTALEEVLKSNFPGGVINSECDSISIDSHGNIVDAPKGKFVGLIGAENLIIVQTPDALLICSKDKAQDIKKLVSLLEQNKKLGKKLL